MKDQKGYADGHCGPAFNYRNGKVFSSDTGMFYFFDVVVGAVEDDQQAEDITLHCVESKRSWVEASFSIKRMIETDDHRDNEYYPVK